MQNVWRRFSAKLFQNSPGTSQKKFPLNKASGLIHSEGKSQCDSTHLKGKKICKTGYRKNLTYHWPVLPP